MKIRMKTLAAGPDYLYQPGQEVDVPESVALAWIKLGNAEPVGTERETAAVEPPEQTVMPKKRSRRQSSTKSSSKKG